MSKQKSLEKEIVNFTSNAIEPFTLSSATKTIRSMVSSPPKNLQDIIANALTRDRWIFFDNKKRKFFPRSNYFQDAQFRIAPLKLEIDAGILFPGHRFLPFYMHEVFPTSFKLTYSSGNTLRRKKVSYPMKDVVIFHTLLGQEHMLNYFIMDNEKNHDVFMTVENPFDQKIDLTAFNLKSFYEENDFQEGDTITVTVKDWKKGAFSLEFSPASDLSRDFMLCRQWFNGFENAIGKVFDDFGTLPDIHEQLSLAFFYMGKDLLKFPGIHIGGFLQQSKKVEITSLGLTTMLWKKGEAPEDSIPMDEEFYSWIATGNSDSLDSIFQDIGLGITEGEIEAYIRDELYREAEKAKIENVLERCFPQSPLFFYDGKQEKEFDRLIKKLWKSVKKKYNIFQDKGASECRTMLLKILDDYKTWLRSFDHLSELPENFPKKEMVTLTQMMSNISHIVEELNSGENITPPGQDFIPMIEDMQSANQFLMELISSSVSSGQKQELQLVTSPPKKQKKSSQKNSKKKTASKNAYQLKVSLKHIRPPIWRRIQINGDSTLEDLHEIIQASMGWEDCHEHMFYINEKEYGREHCGDDLLGFGASENLDESEFTLDDVLLKAKMRFLYEYDFGDSWEHQVLVEKILPLDGKIKYPTCLTGKRSCPPEDCGGVPGYYQLLEAIENPEVSDAEELIDCLGEDYDPDEFNVKKANKSLKSFAKR